MQYVRSLEQRVKQLEDDKRGLTHKINQLATSVGDPSLAVPSEATSNSALSGRPEAVVRALQVLEVREQLEMEGRLSSELAGEIMSDNSPSVDMDDGEKALVREMCNVSMCWCVDEFIWKRVLMVAYHHIWVGRKKIIFC